MIRPSAFVAIVALLLPAPGAGAHPGWGIVVDSKGSVHFVDLAQETIWTVSPEGRLTGTHVARHLHSLFIDTDDVLRFDHQAYEGPPVMVGEPPRLEEAGTRMVSVWRLSPDSGLRLDVPARPAIPGTRDQPVVDDFADGSGPFRDAAGNGYGIEYVDGGATLRLVRRVEASPDGRVETLAERVVERDARESDLPPDLDFIQARAWGRDGSILLTEGGRVRRLSLRGTMTTVLDRAGLAAPSDPPRQDRLLGVAEGEDGRVFVADLASRCVHVVDGDGSVSVVRAPAGFWSPIGVTTSGDGLHVLEVRTDPVGPLLSLVGVTGGLGGPRVVRLDPDGRAVVLATVNGHRVWIARGLVVLLIALSIAGVARRVAKRRRSREQRGSTRADSPQV